jgi:formate dehydrogenase subunit delta
MSPDKLVHMANQIGKFFAHEGETRAAKSVATHLRRYWDPRMRRAILAHYDSGGAGLDPIVREAVGSLKEQ